MMTLPPSWKACRSSRPSAGLPRVSRSSGGSMPWSTALRSRCVSGSRMASMIVLSSSVSWPSMSMRACLPQATARSRTTRGNLFQMLPIGCMRVFMTLACSSVVSRFSRCTVPRKAASSCEVLNCMIWFRARTSSPTRVMSLSSRPTSTRMALSETAGARGSAGSAASGHGGARREHDAHGARRSRRGTGLEDRGRLASAAGAAAPARPGSPARRRRRGRRGGNGRGGRNGRGRRDVTARRRLRAGRARLPVSSSAPGVWISAE